MMTKTILDLGPERTEKGVTVRHLWIAGTEGRRIPGLVLTPEGAEGARPAVMLGHGGSGSKDEAQMLSIARWLVRREGFAVAIIDGPVHGERKPPEAQVGLEREVLAQRETYRAMAADWRATVDACGELSNVGNDRVAYLGFSMGTILGILTVAEEPRFRCAVLAIGGIMPERMGMLAEAASRIQIPVLMINQSEDELFPREWAFGLYDKLAGPKRLYFHPGLHAGVPREAMERVRGFLHGQLAGEQDEIAAPRGAY